MHPESVDLAVHNQSGRRELAVADRGRMEGVEQLVQLSPHVDESLQGGVRVLYKPACPAICHRHEQWRRVQGTGWLVLAPLVQCTAQLCTQHNTQTQEWRFFDAER